MAIEIYSTDTDSGSVTVVEKVDGGYSTVGQIDVGNAPRGGVKFTRDGRGYVCNTSQNTISELDLREHREVGRIEVGFGPRGLGIVPGDRYALVSNSGGDSVSVVDLDARQEMARIPVGRDPRHMAITKDGLFAYVCVWGGHHVAKLDLFSLKWGEPTDVREVSRIATGSASHPYSLAIDPSGRQVFVANTQAPYVTVIDTETETVRNVDLGRQGARAVTFTADGRFALITVETDSTVAVIDVDTLVRTRDIPVGAGPRGLALDARDDSLYISNFSRGAVFAKGAPQFEHNTLTVIDLKSAPLDRDEGEFDYHDVFVGFGPCSVTLFDTATLEEEAWPYPRKCGMTTGWAEQR